MRTKKRFLFAWLLRLYFYGCDTMVTTILKQSRQRFLARSVRGP